MKGLLGEYLDEGRAKQKRRRDSDFASARPQELNWAEYYKEYWRKNHRLTFWLQRIDMEVDDEQ